MIRLLLTDVLSKTTLFDGLHGARVECTNQSPRVHSSIGAATNDAITGPNIQRRVNLEPLKLTTVASRAAAATVLT